MVLWYKVIICIFITVSGVPQYTEHIHYKISAVYQCGLCVWLLFLNIPLMKLDFLHQWIFLKFLVIIKVCLLLLSNSQLHYLVSHDLVSETPSGYMQPLL